MHYKEIDKMQNIYMRWIQKLWKKYRDKDMSYFQHSWAGPKNVHLDDGSTAALSREDSRNTYSPQHHHKILRDAGIAEK